MSKKRKTIQIRISEEDHAEILKASEIKDTSMSKILLDGGIDRANKIIKENEKELKQIEKGQ